MKPLVEPSFIRLGISFLLSKTTRRTFIVVGNRNLSNRAKLKDLLLTMPKETIHIPPLKEGRKAKKESSVKYPAGIINLQVLGSGAKGSPRSLYVFTDQTRYLFNCGEGTQRLAHEHKMKLAKLEHVFITHKTWDNTGGLPGVALTIQDIGVPEITLHGPPNLEKIFEGTRRFVVLKDLKIKVADCSVDTFGDHIMQVDYVKLVPISDESIDKSSSSEESLIEEDDTDYYAPIKGCKRHLEITQQEVVVKGIIDCLKLYTRPDPKKRTKLEGSPEETLEQLHPETAMCYICRPRKKEGMLLIEKCVDYGVPPGPLLGKLKSGQDVTLPNGKIVKAKDVRSVDCPGPVFIVVDCPDERYLDSFTNNHILSKYHNPESPEDFPHVVVHFTPANVMAHPRYIQWMEKFRVTTKHLVLNDSCKGMGSEAVHRIQHKLNILDKDMFPLLKEDGVELFYSTGTDDKERITNETLYKSEILKGLNVPVIMGSTLLKYGLRPSPEVDTSATFTIKPDEDVREVLDTEEFPPHLEKLKSQLGSFTSSNIDHNTAYPEFLFLGTGSCIPNKTRNTSGILVHVDSANSILMDCGEGTYGQLVRFYGNMEVEQVLTKIKAIYISHLHADHHIGLVQLLRKRWNAFLNQKLPPTPAFLLAPHQIQTWLHLYHKFFEKIKNAYQLIPNTELRYNFTGPEEHTIPITELKYALGLTQVQTTFVRHCPNAFGVAFTHSSGWKLTYSGDTMPCDGLVEIGRDSDVLIHESTMEDDLKQEAIIKMHSTTSEAIEVGNKMQAKFILLTHFSQRYAKVPVINEKFVSNVGIAFDNMRVRRCDLPKIPLMYDALKAMFTEDVEEMEQKTIRRLKRKEILAMNVKQMTGSNRMT